jgi:serine/threonine-protein kinase RsbW
LGEPCWSIARRTAKVEVVRELEEPQQRGLRRPRTREQQQAFLLRVSQLVANARDDAEVLDRLAQAAVPTLADLCLIDVLRGDGRLVRVAARHADPELQEVVDELRDHYAPDPAGDHPSAEVIRSGRIRWSPVMSAEFLDSTTLDDHHLGLVRRLRLRSYIAVPIFAASRVLGAIVLVSAGAGRRYGERDVDLAYEFAGYAARAIADVERNDAARETAQALQASLLPDELPEVPGLDIAVEYLPANVDHEVGGDFYDLVTTEPDTAFLVIGDVAGHDIFAAGVMGKLRTAARVLADPAEGAAGLVTRLHEQWLRIETGRMATIAAAMIDLRNGDLRIASAGHPAPLMVVPSGAEFLDVTPSPPLGAGGGAVVEWRGTLPPGWTLFLYTDGLVERHDRSWDDGMSALVATVRGCVDPHRLCRRVLDELVTDPARKDDVAILAVSRRPPA